MGVLSNSSTSDAENNSDDEFFDAEMEGEWSVPANQSSRPIVMSVPVAEGDPSDVEEEEDYDEEDNASGKGLINGAEKMEMKVGELMGVDVCLCRIHS